MGSVQPSRQRERPGLQDGLRVEPSSSTYSGGHATRAGAKSPGQSLYASSGLSVFFAADAPCFAATSLTG